MQLPKLNQEGNLQFHPEREQDCLMLCLGLGNGMVKDCAEKKLNFTRRSFSLREHLYAS